MAAETKLASMRRWAAEAAEAPRSAAAVAPARAREASFIVEPLTRNARLTSPRYTGGMYRARLPTAPTYAVGLAALAAFLAVGLVGTRSYLDNYLQYRGFAPPQDPAYVKQPGTVQRILVSSPALGG